MFSLLFSRERLMDHARQATGLTTCRGVSEVALPLRDSAGISPDFADEHAPQLLLRHLRR